MPMYHWLSTILLVSIVFTEVLCTHTFLKETHGQGLIFELKRAETTKRELGCDRSYQFDMLNFNKMQYFIEISMGSKRQTMRFLIDTGSSVRMVLFNLHFR